MANVLVLSSAQGRQSTQRYVAHSCYRHMSEWGSLLRQAFIAGSLLDYHEGHVNPLACCQHEHCKTARPWLRAFHRRTNEKLSWR